MHELDVVGEAADEGHAQAALNGPVALLELLGGLRLEARAGVGDEDGELALRRRPEAHDHSLARALAAVSEDRVGRRLAHGDAQILDPLLVHARAPRSRDDDKPCQSDVLGVRRELELHLRQHQASSWSASSSESWMGKTFVRPVILKIFRMRS